MLSPVQIEQEMVKALSSITKSVGPVSKAYDAWKQAELAYKKAYAVAFAGAEGSVEDRKQQATLDTYDAATDMHTAEAQYRYMVDLQKTYRDKLSAFQTLAKSVLAAYGAAGVGER